MSEATLVPQPWDTPALKREGDDFLYLWQNLGVGIGLTGLYEGDHGQVHGELTVATVNPATGDRNGLIEFCSLNLCVHQTRKTLVGSLNGRERGLIDWEKALRHVTYRTVQAYRTGDPVVNLAQVQIDRSRRFLVEGILPDRQVAIFYGDGMSGKSMTAALVAIAVQAGYEIAGVIRPTRRANVLFLDYETQAEEQADRIDQLAAGCGLERPPILYRKPRRLLADDMTAIRREVAQHDIGLLIVDSMHLAAGNVVDFDAVGRFNNALTTLSDVTKLVVTHVSKAGAAQESGKASPLGLAQVNNYGRSNWEFRAERSDALGWIDVGMFHRKVNNGRLQRPIALRYQFDERGPTITPLPGDLEDSPALIAHGSNVDRIRYALRQGDRTTHELAEETGISEAVLRVNLSRMADVVSQQAVANGAKTGRPTNLWHLENKAG